MLTTADGGASWSLPGRVRVPGLAAVTQVPGAAFAVGVDGRLLVRSATAPGWRSRRVAHRRPDEVDRMANLTSVAFFDRDRGVAGGASAFLRWTEDGGETWTEAALPAGITRAVTALDVAVGVAFAGLADGTLLRSADGGRSWTRAAPSGLVEIRSLQALGPTSVWVGGRDAAGRMAVRRYNGVWLPSLAGGQGTVTALHAGAQGGDQHPAPGRPSLPLAGPGLGAGRHPELHRLPLPRRHRHGLRSHRDRRAVQVGRSRHHLGNIGRQRRPTGGRPGGRAPRPARGRRRRSGFGRRQRRHPP